MFGLNALLLVLQTSATQSVLIKLALATFPGHSTASCYSAGHVSPSSLLRTPRRIKFQIYHKWPYTRALHILQRIDWPPQNPSIEPARVQIHATEHLVCPGRAGNHPVVALATRSGQSSQPARRTPSNSRPFRSWKPTSLRIDRTGECGGYREELQ